LTAGTALNQNLKATTLRGGAFALAAEGIDFVLRLGSAIVLARLLVPEYFGLVGMVTAITVVAEYFKDLGLGSATIQSPTISHKQISTLMWINAGMGVLMMGALAALAHPFSLFYGEPRLTDIILVLSTTFFWRGAANQHYALLLRMMKFGRTAGIQITASSLSILVAVVMALMGYGYWALVGREVSRNMFYAVGCWFCLPWVPGPPQRGTGAGRMLTFGVDLTSLNLVTLLGTSLDMVLIGRVFGAHDLGIYRQGLQMVLTPMQQLAYPVGAVAQSSLSRLQDDPNRYRNYYRGILRTLSFATFPLGLFMAIFAPEIVAVVLGPQWEPAAPIFRILALAVFLQPALATTSTIMITCGYSRRLLWMGTVSTAVLLVFFVVGIPFGLNGVASAHIWALLLLLVPRVIWGTRNTPVTPAMFFSAISHPAACSAAMVVVLVAFKYFIHIESTVARLVGAVGLALIAYFGSWLLFRQGREELWTMICEIRATLGGGRSRPSPVSSRVSAVAAAGQSSPHH
jgi:PST family polysaccharide transporter